MLWIQKQFSLPPQRRGFHLITPQVMQELPELSDIRVGLLNLFLQHTSASLSINENADPEVPVDLEMAFNQIAQEGFPYVHTMEGPDDMPAHVKCSMIGASLVIPITQGNLAFGTWQGIYLCEHRNHASSRSIIATIQGEKLS